MQWDAERYVREAGFVPALGAPLLDLLAPRPGERVLDLGCGDGRLSVQLAERGCRVVCIDSSPGQVALARAQGLDARLLDAHLLPFAAEFDAVFSNAALHWMTDPTRVATGVFRSLRPGGRFVAEMGGAGNVARIVDALSTALAARGIDAAALNPWYFPTPATQAAVLEAAGFTIRSLAFFDRPTPYERDVGDWLTLMAVPFLDAMPGAPARAALVDEVRERLRPGLLDASGVWRLDYVRLRFVAEKVS